MFELVAIAILGCCIVIDLLSGQSGRAGGAGLILVCVGIWLVYALIKDAVEDHKKRKADDEAWEAMARYSEQMKEYWKNPHGNPPELPPKRKD